MRYRFSVALTLATLPATAASAQEAKEPAMQRSALDFTHCWGGEKACTHTQSRAGCPESNAWYARSAGSSAFVGYYVGGGNVLRGEARSAAEGTWGWDYQGFGPWRRVALSWTHGRRSQGGTGDYRTDGGRKFRTCLRTSIQPSIATDRRVHFPAPCPHSCGKLPLAISKPVWSWPSLSPAWKSW